MLTQERLKEALHYNPETGIFTWLISTSNRAKVGDVAGSYCTHGYRRVRIDGKAHRSHRLAWLYVYGEFPKQDIDHINRVTDDNRIANLRDVSTSVNVQNRKTSTTKKSGFLGVRQDGKKFAATIRVNGETIYIGRFGTAAEAYIAYLSAKRKYHGGFLG